MFNNFSKVGLRKEGEMASNATKTQVLSLYKSLMRESKKFQAYNFRMYALRRVRDAFRQYKHLKEPQDINNKISEAQKNLEIIKRQVIVHGLYASDPLVIEKGRIT